MTRVPIWKLPPSADGPNVAVDLSGVSLTLTYAEAQALRRRLDAVGGEGGGVDLGDLQITMAVPAAMALGSKLQSAAAEAFRGPPDPLDYQPRAAAPDPARKGAGKSRVPWGQVWSDEAVRDRVMGRAPQPEDRPLTESERTREFEKRYRANLEAGVNATDLNNLRKK